MRLADNGIYQFMSWSETHVLPIIFSLIIGFLMWFIAGLYPDPDLDTIIRLIAPVLFSVLGLLFIVSGLLANWLTNSHIEGPDLKQNPSLSRCGVYRITRNPAPVGLACLLTGWAAWLVSLWALLLVVGFIFFMNRYQIIPQEKALKRVYGDDYKQYMMNVSRWL